LGARIVVVELARRLPSGPLEQRRDRVAERRLTPVPDVQRASWIRGNELHVHRLAGAAGGLSERNTCRNKRREALRNRTGGHAKVDEPGPGDLRGRQARALEIEGGNERVRDLARLLA